MSKRLQDYPEPNPASLNISTGRPTGAFSLDHGTVELYPFRDSFSDTLGHDATLSPTTDSVPVPRTFPPSVPAAALVLPPVDPPDVPFNMTTPLAHPMHAAVAYEGSGDDVPAEPAGHSDDLAFPTAAGPAEQTTNATAATIVGPVPAVSSAALTPAQWAALPPTTTADMIMKAP